MILQKFQQDLCPGSNSRSSLSITYDDSPDLQMLLNLLAEKEGIWAALIILCLFDRNFRSEFRVHIKDVTAKSQ